MPILFFLEKFYFIIIVIHFFCSICLFLYIRKQLIFCLVNFDFISDCLCHLYSLELSIDFLCVSNLIFQAHQFFSFIALSLILFGLHCRSYYSYCSFSICCLVFNFSFSLISVIFKITLPL